MRRCNGFFDLTGEVKPMKIQHMQALGVLNILTVRSNKQRTTSLVYKWHLRSEGRGTIYLQVPCPRGALPSKWPSHGPHMIYTLRGQLQAIFMPSEIIQGVKEVVQRNSTVNYTKVPSGTLAKHSHQAEHFKVSVFICVVSNSVAGADWWLTVRQRHHGLGFANQEKNQSSAERR